MIEIWQSRLQGVCQRANIGDLNLVENSLRKTCVDSYHILAILERQNDGLDSAAVCPKEL